MCLMRVIDLSLSEAVLRRPVSSARCAALCGLTWATCLPVVSVAALHAFLLSLCAPTGSILCFFFSLLSLPRFTWLLMRLEVAAENLLLEDVAKVPSLASGDIACIRRRCLVVSISFTFVSAQSFVE